MRTMYTWLVVGSKPPLTRDRQSSHEMCRLISMGLKIQDIKQLSNDKLVDFNGNKFTKNNI